MLIFLCSLKKTNNANVLNLHSCTKTCWLATLLRSFNLCQLMWCYPNLHIYIFQFLHVAECFFPVIYFVIQTVFFNYNISDTDSFLWKSSFLDLHILVSLNCSMLVSNSVEDRTLIEGGGVGGEYSYIQTYLNDFLWKRYENKKKLVDNKKIYQ